MLESLVAGLLNRTLGNYVENFDPKQLNIGIWSGDVKLSNLKLKKESLDGFELPIDVKYGFLGQLTLQIPWSNLRGKPVKVIIEDAYLLATPMLIEEYDEAKIKERELALKKKKLQELDMLEENKLKLRQETDSQVGSDDIKKQESFTESLLTKIVDNLQVTIKNIHLRYEDSSVFTKIPYSFGVTLDELSAVSTDGSWKESFVALTSTFARKLLTLKSLSCYFNSESTSLISKSVGSDGIDEEDLLQKFKQLIVKETDDFSSDMEGVELFKNHNFLVRPISGNGKISVNKLGSTETDPHIFSELFFKEFIVNLNSDQYRDILNTASNYRFYVKTFKFKKFRPKDMKPSEHPLEWFKYAAEVVRSEIHEKNHKWSWEYFKQRRDVRKAYIKVYKETLAKDRENQATTAELTSELNDLEKDISYEDIKFYRSLARAQYRKEKLDQKTKTGAVVTQNTSTEETAGGKEEEKDSVAASQAPVTTNKGWFGGWWGGADTSNSANSDSSAHSDLIMTEEQKRELYDAIEFDEQQALIEVIDIPKDRVKLKLFASLEKGSFSIHNKATNLAEIMWEGCNFQFLERPGSYLSKFTLQEFKIKDSDDSSTLYNHIVSIKPVEDVAKSVSDSEKSSEEQVSDPFFQVSFESNPLDNSGDSKLLAKLKSMTIFYHADFLEKVVKFFTPPKQHQDTISAILNAAEATVEGLTNQTKMGLRYALEEHKTVNIQLDLQAPLILLPLDPTDWNSPCGIIDAGHISVMSDLIAKNDASGLIAKKPNEFDDSDWARLKELMFDKFNLHLHDAKLLIGPTIKSTMEQLHQESDVSSALILKDFNTNFLVQVSILPQAFNFPRFKISGEVPSLKATMSDYQYKIILQLFDKLLPEFGEIGFVDENLPDVYYDGDVDSLFNVFENTSYDSEFSDAVSFIESDDENGKQQDDRPSSRDSKNIYIHPLTSPRESRDVLSPTTKVQSNTDSSSNPGKDKQHKFDFSFKIGVVNLALDKCVNSPFEPSTPMVNLICENFQLDFYRTQKDTKVDILLSDFNLIDKLQTSGPEEFQKIVSSNNFTQSDQKTKQQDLIKVNYLRSQRLVELNDQVIELYDSDVKLDIAAVKAVVNRRNLLKIYTYIMTTFTKPNDENDPANQLRHNTEENTESAPQMINVVIGLEGVILLMLDDNADISTKLATMSLATGEIDVLLLPEKMKVHFKIGDLTLHDEINEGSPRDSIARKILSIKDGDSAEMIYETFDPATNQNLFDSRIKFRTGSLTLNWIEQPCKKVLGWFMNLLKMKGLFDAARDTNYNQVETVQAGEDSDRRISYDVLIKTPILVFPKLDGGDFENFNVFTAYLGEFKASNDFTRVKEKNDAVLSKIFASLTSTRLTSEFFFDGQRQFLEIIDGIDMTFDIDNGFGVSDPSRASMIIDCNMTDSEIRLTEFQLEYLMELVGYVPRTFQYDNEEELIEQVEEDAIDASITVTNDPSDSQRLTKESKALFHKEDSVAVIVNADQLKYHFKFNVGKLALSIYNDTRHVRNIQDVKQKRLSRFSLNEIGIDFQMKESSNYVSDIHTRSFTVEDIRVDKDNLYTEIIPEVNHDNYQFMCKVFSEGGVDDSQLTVMLTVDSPKMILALDYLFSVKDYIWKGLNMYTYDEDEERNSDEEDEGDDDLHELTLTDSADSSRPKRRFSYTVNIIDFSLILLSNPAVKNTEAIVLKLEQLLMSSHNTTTLMANNVGMFLCHMSDYEGSRLRIIDDFSASFSYDSRNSTATEFLATAQLSIEPLLLRLSLSDIRLALVIINRAYELAGINPKESSIVRQKPGYTTFTQEFKQKLAKNFQAGSVYSGHSGHSSLTKRTSISKKQNTVKTETLNADFEGLRLVILGDVHELPVIDMSLKQFTVVAQNWSTNLDLTAQLESYVNIFNYAKSSWEPLVEPWKVNVNVSKTLSSDEDTLNVDIVSRDVAEVTITQRTIILLSQMYSLLSLDSNIAPRGTYAPYKILNQTGYDVNIWIDSEDTKERHNLTTIKRNETKPWQFEDWTVIREKLDVDSGKNSIAVELLNSPYKVVDSISLVGEGEELFVMSPPIQGVHNRLACSVTLNKENVKEVVLKSTITLKNTSPVDIQIGVGLSSDSGANEIYSVASGESFALPIDYVYSEPFAIRPNLNGFSWSSKRIRWKSLYQRPTSLECKLKDDTNESFFFQIEAERKAAGKSKMIYPHLQIVISSPLKLENLLPYDSTFWIYDKTNKTSRSVNLKSGDSSNVHFVNVTHLLLLSVMPLKCGFPKKSEFVIINSPPGSDFPVDDILRINHEDGQKLNMKISYGDVKDDEYTNAGNALKISVYSPYVVLNRTGQNLILGEKYNALHSTASHNAKDSTKIKSSQPKMFSFENERERNRAFLSVADSHWSREISLDAIGQFFDLSMPTNTKKSEINVGVDIQQGEGKFSDIKIVTISPRFIITNNLSFELNVNEVGSSSIFSLKPGETVPLIQTGSGDEKELRLRHLGSESKWSSPFSIKDVGEMYLKILSQVSGNALLKVIVILENATLFIRFEDAQDHWPYSIRNFSNTEFIFYQSNPYVDENESPVKSHSHFKPIFYKLPPKSVMPYAWDYPAGVVKELILRSHGTDRSIQLAEIGNLGVMQLPQFKSLPPSAVEINIMADGPTQAVVISDAELTSVYSRSTSTLASGSTTVSKIQAKETEHYSTRVAVNFQGVGISIIDAKLRELCYLTFRGFELKYNESDLYRTFICNLKWIQLDNQLFGSPCPIVLYPTIVPQSTDEVEAHPTIHMSVSRVKDDSHGVLFIKYATILLQEMTVDIDQNFVTAVIEFTKMPLFNADDDKGDVLCEEIIELPVPSNSTFGEDIYFEALHLQPTQINLSLMGTDEVKSGNKGSSQQGIMFFLNMMAKAVISINDAPIKLNALFIENMRVPIPTLLDAIRTHYSQDFLYQLHKVLGSADFLGNPVGLFNNISSGVMDIFYEPYLGLVMNDRPQELGISIAKGGLSFLKKSVFGVSDSFAKFTGTVARGLSMATLDEEYRKKRNLNLRRNKPKHALVGFKSGATSFIDSLSSGVSGIALAPIEGATSGGASGFLMGIGKGIVGLPTKAAIGVFDLASNVSEGIRNTTTVFDNNTLSRVRLPRAISHDGIVRPFSEHDATGQYWLKTINGGEFSDDGDDPDLIGEQYLTHMALPGGDLVIMLTFNSIMLISITYQQVKWKISFEEISSITLEPTGIKIGLYDNRPAPFVPIPDAGSQRELYNHIAVAVKEYNRHLRSIL